MASTSPDPGSSLARLIPQKNLGPTSEIDIRSPVVRIGQGPQNDVLLDDDSVSSKHARLEYDGGLWRVTDLASRNGTYLDGQRLSADVPTHVPDGAIVGFGAVKLEFKMSSGVDPERARAAFTPPPEKPRLAERSSFRLPLWIVILAILVIVAIVFFVLSGGGEAAAADTVSLVSAVFDFDRGEWFQT